MSKKIKAILSLMLIVALTASLTIPSFAAEPVLKCGNDGKFTILQLADCQDDGTPQPIMIQFIEKALDAVKPDLVVFGGDNVVGTSDDGVTAKQNIANGISAIITPCVERNIPFTLVFGNHDHEAGLEEEEILEMYQEYTGCLAYDADPALYGTGTHYLPVLSSKNDKPAFSLYLVDSNEYDDELSEKYDQTVYDYVHADQIKWYEDTEADITTANGGKQVPAILFQHIVVPDVYRATVKIPFLNTTFIPTDGENNYIPVFNYLSGNARGVILEAPCSPRVNSGQFASWVKQGNMLAAFFAHDHINEYTVSLDGVDLVQTPGAGFNSYGKFHLRGARVITLDENTGDYSTSMYRFTDAYGIGSAAYQAIVDNCPKRAEEHTSKLAIAKFIEKIGMMPLVETVYKSLMQTFYGE